MKRDDRVYLNHMLDAITQVETYLNSATKQQFIEENMLHDAVIRQLEIVGEASRNISEEIQEKYSLVPWGQIIAMRNRIVHAYFDVNLEIAWDIYTHDLPELKLQIQKILNEL
jgi:uncharacterized protein with HEPN domain